MSKAWNKTRVSQKLGIDYPIIQGPLGGLSSQRLTAAVSNFGGLGSFGALSLEPSAIADVVSEIRSLTTKPFAMNLWVSMEDSRCWPYGQDKVPISPVARVSANCSSRWWMALLKESEAFPYIFQRHSDTPICRR